MSLTSYRAAPPRGTWPMAAGVFCGAAIGPVEMAEDGCEGGGRRRSVLWRLASVIGRSALGGPGGDLLSRALRRSTIGAEGFHGRVRNGIGCSPLAMATRSPQGGGQRREDERGGRRRSASTAPNGRVPGFRHV